MAEEVVWIIESWESWWSLNEWVQESAVQKVQENARQIKKIAQQLKQDKQQNNQLANFLTFLLREITNDNIIKWLYDTFFVTVDPKTNIPYFRKSMNDVVVVGLFYPFFVEKAQEIWVDHYYSKLACAGEKSIGGYMTYLQDLSTNYHDNIPVNQTSFIQLMVEIIKEYLTSATDAPKLDNKNSDDVYKQIVYEKLFLVDWESDIEEVSNEN